MRGLVGVCLLAASLVGGSGAGPAAAGERRQINWYRDYELARSESKLLGRPMLVYVSSKWSPACLRLERSTYLDPKLVEFFSNSVLAVYVGADASPELAARLNAESPPVAVILLPDGSELGRIEGYRTAESLIAELGRLIESNQSRNDAVRSKSHLNQVRVASAPSVPTRPDIRLTVHTDDTPGESADAPFVAAPVPKPVIMLDGCCPVSMLETKNLIRGDPDITWEYDGRMICFRSAEQREKFQADAARYLPVFGGRCAVSFVEEGCEKTGLPRFGAVFRNRLYVFAGAEERGRFQANPKRYVDCDVAHEGYCPVCESESGWLEPGSRDLQHVVQRHLYRFDSEQHRRRFAADPQSFGAGK